jgi:hypothetical protein
MLLDTDEGIIPEFICRTLPIYLAQPAMTCPTPLRGPANAANAFCDGQNVFHGTRVAYLQHDARLGHTNDANTHRLAISKWHLNRSCVH